MTDSDSVPVGNCPEHGPVYGDDLEFNFPNVAECAKDDCGCECEQVVLADPTEHDIVVNGP
jgi:hypothetical protein